MNVIAVYDKNHHEPLPMAIFLRKLYHNERTEIQPGEEDPGTYRFF